MKKWFTLILLLLILLGMGFLTFKNRKIIHKSIPPQKIDRIICMAPTLTEISYALGLGDKIAAVTTLSNYPPAAKQKPKIGSFWQPDIEAIIRIHPDLVLTLGFQHDIANRLEKLGINTLTLPYETFDDLFEAIKKIGEATATEQKAKALVNDIQNRLDTIRRLTQDKPKISVLYIVQQDPLRVAGTDTFINEMIKIAGGINAIGPTIQKYPPIGTEQLIAGAPEVIIIPSMGLDLEAAKKNAEDFKKKFANIGAVINNRIYIVDDDTISQLGPRLAEGVETIAKCLRPDLFK